MYLWNVLFENAAEDFIPAVLAGLAVAYGGDFLINKPVDMLPVSLENKALIKEGSKMGLLLYLGHNAQVWSGFSSPSVGSKMSMTKSRMRQ